MKRRKGSRLGQATLTLALSLLPALALADARDDARASTGFAAELFALGTFVLLALAAHWGARRRNREP
jgi:hypothetical protein